VITKRLGTLLLLNLVSSSSLFTKLVTILLVLFIGLPLNIREAGGNLKRFIKLLMTHLLEGGFYIVREFLGRA